MHLYDVAVRVMKKDLIPARHGPGAIVGIGDLLLFQAALEGLDVVGPEAEMALVERVDEMLHAEAEIDVPAREVEFDGAIGHEVDIAAISRGITGVDTLVVDGSQFEDGSIEFGEALHILGAQVHVVILDLHRLVPSSDFAF